MCGTDDNQKGYKREERTLLPLLPLLLSYRHSNAPGDKPGALLRAMGLECVSTSGNRRHCRGRGQDSHRQVRRREPRQRYSMVQIL